MAMNPNPDRDVKYMKERWGTNRLITDYVLTNKEKVNTNKEHVKETNEPPTDRYSRPCGGKDGFDDYVERWHE